MREDVDVSNGISFDTQCQSVLTRPCVCQRHPPVTFSSELRLASSPAQISYVDILFTPPPGGCLSRPHVSSLPLRHQEAGQLLYKYRPSFLVLIPPSGCENLATGFVLNHICASAFTVDLFTFKISFERFRSLLHTHHSRRFS